MNRRRFHSLLPLLLPSLGLAQGSTAVDGPRGRFEDDLVSNLEGRWNLVRHIRGTTVRNEARGSWVLNHQFLQLHMKDVETPPRYEALVHIGYIYSERLYVAHWADTFGAKFSGVGRGRRTGNSIEFRFDYPDAPFFNTFTWHPERMEWTFRMESQDASGGRQPFATDTLSPQSR